MEQRVYHGNISPDALADYLVQTFNQNFSYAGYNSRYTTMAQKVGQGDQLLVQITRARTWSGRTRGALGVSITRVADGISVSTGQSNWLDLEDPSIAGMLIGGIFFPPLLIFPIIRGISSYTFYQDIWNAIDTFSTQAGARRGEATTAHGINCPYCGSINDEGVAQCHTCGGPLNAAPPAPQAQQSRYERPAAEGASNERVTCPNCGSQVLAAKFCSNCAAPLNPAAV